MDSKPGKRTAIILSGLVRTGALPKALAHFQRVYGHLNADLFYHTWTTDHTDEVVDMYKPKKYLVEPPLTANQSSFGNMLYTIMMSNRLKREYELENNFRYDLVIKARFDLAYPATFKFVEPFILARTIYSSGGNEGLNHTDFETHGISDVVFWGDSQAMDIACDTYMYYKHTCIKMDEQINLSGLITDPLNIYMSPGTLIMNTAQKNNIHFVKHAQVDGMAVEEIPWRIDSTKFNPDTQYNDIKERYNNDRK